MKQFDKFSAIFDPPEPHTLKEEGKPFIGKRMDFEVYWICDNDEQFAGECACWSDELDFWVPERDLKEIKEQT